jgi:hypothetical protein
MLGNASLIAPELEWAVATQFAYLRGQWFRVLLEVEESVVSFVSAVRDLEAQDLFIIPSVFERPPNGFKPSDITFCMAIMNRDTLELLVTEGKLRLSSGATFEPAVIEKLARLAPLIKTIELGTPIEMPMTKEGSDKKVEDDLVEESKATTQKVVVGVIDDGLAFAHERFRFSNGKTRFKYFLNQDDPAFFVLGPGIELTENRINLLLGQCTHASIVDEDWFYRRIGQNLVARRAKHGAHVMDIACGLDPQQAGPDAPLLIGVQLPKWVTEETSGALLTATAIYAIHYILNRAGNRPVVINLSYGIIAGPHDGTAPLERAIDQLIATRTAPLRVVLPAGNHHLARCHSRFDLPPATSPNTPDKILRWRVQPDNKADSFMHIWLPLQSPDGTRPQIAVRLVAPNGETSDLVDPGSAWPPIGPPNVRFRLRSVDVAGERPYIKLALAPTTAMTAAVPTAPSGTWRVEIHNLGSAFPIDAWVQRGDTPFGYPLWGRQSRFDDDLYQRFDLAGRLQEEDTGLSSIRRRGTINALGTGQRAIVIGGFRRSDCRPSRYSGAGPVATPTMALPPRTGPDAAAVADDSVALHGVLAAGTRTGSVVAMDGTSVAAPRITRLIAEWMSAGLPSDRAALKTFAGTQDSCPPLTIPASDQRIGAGRIGSPPTYRWRRWP